MAPHKLGDLVQVQRRDGLWPGTFEPLPWPTAVWTANVRSEVTHHLYEELVAEGAPAFLTFDRAAAAFFALPPAPNRSFAGSEITFREQDRRARIQHVRVTASELVVQVDGDGLTGALLATGGVHQPASRRLRKGSRTLTTGTSKSRQKSLPRAVP